MNTPPTRKRNYRNVRRSDKAADQWRSIPDGNYSTGIGSEDVLIAYARAVSLWPQVEDAMTNVLMELIGSRNHEIASEIFHALLAQNTRLPVMKSLLQNTQVNQNKPENFDEIIDEFSRLNNERNPSSTTIGSPILRLAASICAHQTNRWFTPCDTAHSLPPSPSTGFVKPAML